MNKYQVNISNDELNGLPLAKFGGRVLVVDDVASMLKAEGVLAGHALLGVDTETRPSFKKGVVHKMALLQVSTMDVAVLFRLNKISLSAKIKAIMENEAVKKIGAALKDDLKGLQSSQGAMKVRGFVDLQSEIGKWGIEDKSVKKMAGIVVGVKVSKAQRLSNWEANSLTVAQQQYAAIDAWVCLVIYKKLKGLK